MTSGASVAERVRRDLPILAPDESGRVARYFDSAASSLTPEPVVEAMTRYYRGYRSNIHRGRHAFAEEASAAYESSREALAGFLNATPREIVFTSGTTAAINLVARGLPLDADHNVVSTLQEHHSNLLPWMDRAALRLAPVGADGVVDVDALFREVDDRTLLIAISQASNVTGAIHDVREVCRRARERGVLTLIDAAQSAPHLRVDVEELGCDFLALSGHKMLGPTGIGVLFGRREALERLTITHHGGGAVRLVSPTDYTLKGVPHRFEAGTPPIAEAIGLAAAVRYYDELGRDAVYAHERSIATYMQAKLADLPASRVLGPGGDRLAIASIVVDHPGVSGDHVAMILSDAHRVMVRSGHHCCHPYFDSLGVPGALRASAHVYTTEEDVDVLAAALDETLRRLVR